MKLHAENERVSRRFAQLEESLRNTDHNDQRYKVRFNFFTTKKPLLVDERLC